MPSFMKLTDEAFRLKLNYTGEQPAPLQKLVSARQDTAAFQVIVQSDKQYSVNIGQVEWFSAKLGKVGPHDRLRVAVDAPFPVKLHLEDFLTDDDGTEKADILLNQGVRESCANIPTAVWAEVLVPVDADPGDYSVTVSLYSSLYGQDETVVQIQTIPLHVAKHILPPSKDWKFYLDLWQHTSNIARKHDVQLWSDEHFEVLKSYAASLAALGQKSITICACEIPWHGQDCHLDREFKGNLFEYSIIGITRKKDGTFCYDYSAMQKYIDICTEAGISGDIEIFGIVNVWPAEGLVPDKLCPDYPEGIRLRYLDESDGCLKYVRDAEVLKDYVRSLERYFISTNQIDRVRIAADEPSDVEKYRNSLALLQELAPSFRCKCAINHAEFIEEFHDRIDDFVPYLRCTIVEYEHLMRYKQEYSDKRFLWYTCCNSITSPNTFLSTPPIESRMIGILTSILKLDGFLRWNYTVWPDDPRHDIRYSAFEAGDTNFVYPAYNGKVLLSLRYKNLQRGIADFELVQQLRAEKGDEIADTLVRRILRTDDIRDFWNDTDGTFKNWKYSKDLFSMDWNDFNNLKEEILNLLDA